MYLLLLGLVLMVLKLVGLGPVAGWSWWWVLSPLAGAAAWWTWADARGHGQRKAMAKMERRRKEHERARREALRSKDRR